MTNECRACGAWSMRTYCQPCIDEDTAQTDAWERRYVERCDREFDDGAYERSQQHKEQRSKNLTQLLTLPSKHAPSPWL